MQTISAPAFDFNIRVMLFSSAPMATLRALDVPGVTVCDIVSDARSLPERIARMQPHVLVLESAACHPAALCESVLRANPACPPRVLACFDTDAPVDLPSVSDLPACVRNVMCLPYGRLAAPSIPDRLSCAERLLDALGMPRTLMRLESSTEYAVIEMGMSHAGEIDRLARAARPDVGIITCIGVSHIGNLGSQENICKAKLEICNGLPEGAPLVLNYDDPFLRKAVLPAHVRPVWFSLSDENADVCALSIRQETDGMSFVLEDQEHGTFVVNIPAMGRHNVANALAAYCAATRLGCDAKRVIRGLSNFEQTGRRQKVVDSEGVTVIEDCYNANPDSMKAALAMFKDFPCKRRFALLGDMLELGELSREAHEELGRLAAESGLYCLITYGEQAKRTAVVAAAKGVETLHADSYREAADALLSRVQPGDAVLVKASHGMALEKVLDIFYEEHKEAEV